MEHKKNKIKRSYGLASCPSNGFTSDSINMFARTRYLTHTNKLVAIMVEDVKYKERLNNYFDVIFAQKINKNILM
jgi:hypothetical protein